MHSDLTIEELPELFNRWQGLTTDTPGEIERLYQVLEEKFGMPGVTKKLGPKDYERIHEDIRNVATVLSLDRPASETGLLSLAKLSHTPFSPVWRPINVRRPSSRARVRCRKESREFFFGRPDNWERIVQETLEAHDRVTDPESRQYRERYNHYINRMNQGKFAAADVVETPGDASSYEAFSQLIKGQGCC